MTWNFLTTEEVIEKIRTIARKHGWAVGVHGSLKRDIDLIAVPWTEGACTWIDLWLALSDKGEGGFWRGGISNKPHRRVGTIMLQQGSDPLPDRKNWTPMQIDISFVASNQPDPPFVSADGAHRLTKH